MRFRPAFEILVAAWKERPEHVRRTNDESHFSSNPVSQYFPPHSSVEPAQGAILIVDDDTSVRQALHTTLNTLGFRTSEASGGEAALALARTAPFDVVLLDINMPGMDGLETCRQLRWLLPRIAILMLTVRDSEDDKVQALEAGADDYITKPFHIRE